MLEPLPALEPRLHISARFARNLPQRAALGESGRGKPRQKRCRHGKGRRQGSEQGHLILIRSGLNTISMVRHCSYLSAGSWNPVAPQRMIARRAAS